MDRKFKDYLSLTKDPKRAFINDARPQKNDKHWQNEFFFNIKTLHSKKHPETSNKNAKILNYLAAQERQWEGN